MCFLPWLNCLHKVYTLCAMETIAPFQIAFSKGASNALVRSVACNWNNILWCDSGIFFCPVCVCMHLCTLCLMYLIESNEYIYRQRLSHKFIDMNNYYNHAHVVMQTNVFSVCLFIIFFLNILFPNTLGSYICYWIQMEHKHVNVCTVRISTNRWIMATKIPRILFLILRIVQMAISI